MLFVFTAASPYVTVAEVTTLVHVLSFKLAVGHDGYPPFEVCRHGAACPRVRSSARDAGGSGGMFSCGLWRRQEVPAESVLRTGASV